MTVHSIKGFAPQDAAPTPANDGLVHISEIIAPIVERLSLYQASGARVLNRNGVPHWMTLEEAEREGFRLTALLVKADDPGEILPLVTQLAWAIRDAREAGNDPTPPAAVARAA